ncbi:MAG TPA: dihydrolipoyl dehydrogenase [Anaerovoracaceae bacterium]|nr:dihydrolipoyl dehydrogenase [Anaerovoracaceae bacterium]
MAEIVIMPKLGFNMNEGKLVRWYKSEGETVKKGEPLFSVETDKTSIDIESTLDGVVRRLFISEGESLPVTLPIAIIANEDENIDKLVAEALEKLGENGDTEKQPVSEAESRKETISESGRDFDIIILGGGPGGYVAAIKAAQLGKRTALIEKKRIGGTCLNVGCIPTKTLLKSIEIMKGIKTAENFGVVGVQTESVGLDMEKVQTRKENIVDQLVEGVEGLLAKNGVTVIEGEAGVRDNFTISVNNKLITADNLIIATGSEVKTLPIPTNPAMKINTSDDILNCVNLPKSIAVIGGGVIGIELAYFLANAGSKVVVIEFLDRILPMVDEEITHYATEMLTQLGIKVYTSARVKEITDTSVIFEKDGSDENITVDQVLTAVGRKPSLGNIQWDELGIKTANGAIVTDDTLKTSLDNVYAIGDVNGKAMLAHVASMEGVVAVKNICGETCKIDYRKIPSAIYVQPEIASVGMTEEEATKKYGNVKVGKFPMFANGKAKVEGDESGLIKVIADQKYGEILGVHMYCPHATDMISEATTAMQLEGTTIEMASVIHPHPTVSEALMEAFDDVLGKAIHWN